MTQTKRDTLVLQVGEWAWGNDLTLEKTYVQKTSEMPRMESINRRRSDCKEKELIFGTWNVRTLFRIAALISLVSQIKEYRLAITALQQTRWQGKDVMDIKSHTLFYSGK
jgi:hypothetical protein